MERLITRAEVNIVNNKLLQPGIKWILKSGMAGEFLKGPNLDKARMDTLIVLKGRTLQLGPGTGNDIPFIPFGVNEVVAVDADPKSQCIKLANGFGIKNYNLRKGDL